MMRGVVSLPDQPITQAVLNIWGDLQARFHLPHITEIAYPHFSWHVAEDYDENGLKSKLAELASKTPPITVRTAGLGLFTGENLVLHIPVIRNAQLCELHQTIWELADQYAQQSNPFYAPDLWLPHITIVSPFDLTPQVLPQIVSLLAMDSYNWEFKVASLCVGAYNPGSPGYVECHFPFEGV